MVHILEQEFTSWALMAPSHILPRWVINSSGVQGCIFFSKSRDCSSSQPQNRCWVSIWNKESMSSLWLVDNLNRRKVEQRTKIILKSLILCSLGLFSFRTRLSRAFRDIYKTVPFCRVGFWWRYLSSYQRAQHTVHAFFVGMKRYCGTNPTWK